MDDPFVKWINTYDPNAALHPQHLRAAWDAATDASKSDLFREWSVQMAQGIWHAIEVLEEFEERAEEDDGPFTPKEFHDLRYHLLGTITCHKSGKAIPQVMRDMGIDVDAEDEDD